MNSFKEKNWSYLNKVNKECNKAKAYFSLKNFNIYTPHDEYFSHSEAKKDKNTKKEINKLLNDIHKIKKAIENEKKEQLILSYEAKKKQNFNKQRKFSQSIKISNYLSKAMNNVDNYDSHINRKKTSKKMTTRLKKSFLSFNKTNNNSKFNLITELKKKKNESYNYNNSYTKEKDYQLKRLKIPGAEKLNKEVKLYIEKYGEKYKKEILKESNADLLEKIEDIKSKIKKSDCLKFHREHFYFSQKNQSKIKLFDQIEQKIFDLDKHYIRQSVAKSFED
jgi:hypothetical protein